MILSEFIHKVGFDIEESPLKRLTNDLKEINKRSKETFEGLSKVGEGVKQFGQRMSMFVTTPLIGLGIYSTVLSAKMQKLQLDLRQLVQDQTGSVTEAEASLALLNNQLKDLEKTTKGAFDYDDLLGYSKTMLQMGMPIDQIASKLKTLGQVTLFDPEKISLALTAMSKVQLGGKINIGALRMLGGKPLVDELKKELEPYYGKMEGMEGDLKLKKLESSNLELITKQNLYNALDRLAAKHANYANDLNNIVAGSWQRMTNALNEARLSLGDYILKWTPVAEVLNKITDYVDRLTEKIRSSKSPFALFAAGIIAAIGPLAVLTGSVITFAAKLAASFLSIITYINLRRTEIKINQDVVRQVLGLTKAETSNTVAKRANTFATEQNAIVTRQSALSLEANIGLRNADTAAITRQSMALRGLALSEGGAGLGLLGAGGRLKKEVGVLEKIGLAFKKFFKGIGFAIASLLFLDLKSLPSVFGKVFSKLGFMFAGLFNRIKSIAMWVWKFKAIAAEILIVFLIVQDFIAFMQGKKSVFGMIVKESPAQYLAQVKTFFKGVKDFIIDLWHVAEDVWDLISKAAIYSFSNIYTVISPIIYSIKTSFMSLWDAASFAITKVLSVAKPVFSALWNVIKVFYDKVKPVFETVASPLVFAFESLKSTWDSLANAVSNFYNSLKSQGSPFKKLIEDVEKVVDKVKFVFDVLTFRYDPLKGWDPGWHPTPAKGATTTTAPSTKLSTKTNLIANLPTSPASLVSPEIARASNSGATNNVSTFNTTVNVAVPQGTPSSQIDFIKKAAKDAAESVFQTHLRAAAYAQ